MTDVKAWADQVRETVRRQVIGKDEVVDHLLVAILGRGHALVEDVPGTGKTLIAQTLAQAVGGEFKQIQCTPDLLPADVLGVSVFNQKTGAFTFKAGPVFTNVLLVDEINRATPRTQSALLEAMAEGQVTVEGRSTELPNPFFLIATETPVDSEGTFQLPEVQKDRFFLSLTVGYPSKEAEFEVMARTHENRRADEPSPISDLSKLIDCQHAVLNVEVSDDLQRYILSIIRATRNNADLLLPVSPRGSLALYKASQALAAIRGRDYVVPEDIQEIAVPVLRKRMLIRSEISAKGITEDQAIRQILDSVDVPPLQTVP